MTCEPAYAQNTERFEDFYSVQRSLTRHLAGHGELIKQWLASRPFRGDEKAGRAGKLKSWRTARLNLARRRELKALVAAAGAGSQREEALAQWLLTSMPVRSYLEIADFASPNLRAEGQRDPSRLLRTRRAAQRGLHHGVDRSVTVAELIAALSECDPKLQVKMYGLGRYEVVGWLETKTLPPVTNAFGDHVPAETYVQLHNEPRK